MQGVSEKLRAGTVRPLIALAGVGLIAVVAVYVGFIALESPDAELLINVWGYYVMAGTFALWLISLWQIRRRFLESTWQADPPRAARFGVVAALGVCAILMVAVAGLESFRSKILFDEFVLQSTAFNMHFFREVSTMVRGYELMGAFTSLDNYLDKRPYFYPFLVSLVHDLTGYRTTNAHFLNFALMPLVLMLVYDLGRQWFGWRGGLMGLLLLGGLPLFGQNATGSGMEMINLLMLLLAVRTGGLYLRSPDGPSLTAFCLTVVLLAQSRYESALYVGCAGLVIAVGWWRSGKLVLSAGAALTPLLLIPVAWHNKVLSNTPVLWEMKENQVSRFGSEHVADNAVGVWEYLFSSSRDLSNSLFVSGAGAVGLVVVAGLALRHARRIKRWEPHALVGCAFMVGVLANLVLVLFYFWSRFTDPMASRFSLPLYTAMCLAAVVPLSWLARRFRPTLPIFVTLALLSFVGWSAPKHAHHVYSRMGTDELEWERRTVAAMPEKNRIVLTNKSTLVWLLDKVPSLLLGRAKLVEDRIAHQLSQPTFQEILVTQALRPVSAAGYHQVVPEDQLPENFELEKITERRFGTKIARISRLVAIHPPADGATPTDE